MIPVRDFTVGNTITIGVAIYKKHWKEYLKLSLIAHLWLLVPIYGWARYFAIASHISKMSLNILLQKPNQNKNRNFGINILIVYLNTGVISLMYYFLLICLSIGIIEWLSIDSIVSSISIFFTHFFFKLRVIENLLMFAYLIVVLIPAMFFYARLFVTDLFIDFVFNITTAPIKSSYDLTANNNLKIFLIIQICFAITTPIMVAILYSNLLIFSVFFPDIKTQNNWYFILYSTSCFFTYNLLVVPLWQSLKAVVYYFLTALLDNEWNLNKNYINNFGK